MTFIPHRWVKKATKSLKNFFRNLQMSKKDAKFQKKRRIRRNLGVKKRKIVSKLVEIETEDETT